MKSLNNLVRNLVIFVLLIVLTFMLVFKDQSISDLLNLVLSVNKTYIFLAIICMALYFAFEALNIKTILKTLKKNINFLSMLRYCLVGFFFSGITPSASGGQPMEIYFMHKDGIRVAHSTVALLVQLISFQFITIVCGIIGACFNYNLIKDGLIWLFIAGISLNFIALLTMVICLFSNSLAKKIVNFFVKILAKFKYRNIDKVKENLTSTLDSYKESSRIIKNHKDLFIKSFFIVLCQVASYYTITYCIYKSFGLDTLGYFKIISIQAMLYVSVSSMPLPGAVGISEGAFLGIYNTIFGASLVSGATILNRTVNFYLYIIIGLICTLLSTLKLEINKTKN